MLDFVKLLRGKKQSPVRRSPYKLTWALPHGQPQAGVGIELSTQDVVFAAEIEPASEELDLVVPIRERPVPIRVSVVEKPCFVDKGRPWYRVRGAFLGIAADDFDLLVRELTGVPEPARREEAESSDDDYRLLPLHVQEQIIARLIAMHRLNPVVEGQLPPVRMQSRGTSRDGFGRTVRKVNITSRRRIDDQVMSYNTRFVILPNEEVRALPD